MDAATSTLRAEVELIREPAFPVRAGPDKVTQARPDGEPARTRKGRRAVPCAVNALVSATSSLTSGQERERESSVVGAVAFESAKPNAVVPSGVSVRA